MRPLRWRERNRTCTEGRARVLFPLAATASAAEFAEDRNVDGEGHQGERAVRRAEDEVSTNVVSRVEAHHRGDQTEEEKNADEDFDGLDERAHRSAAAIR